jgi:UMF1 family MFS transporter
VEPNKKTILGWALYDWANSAFATTVMAGFFPMFFKTFWSAGADVNTSTARLGFGNSAASLLVAVLAPVIGAIADRASLRKRFLIFFAYWGALSTASLFFIREGRWGWAIFAYTMGIIGFSGGNIFYDSLLPNIAGEDEVDFVSGLGYALGYLGGGILFLFNVLMATMPEAFGFSDSSQAVRFSFLTVALWWGGFTLFTIRWVPEERMKRPGGGNSIRQGFRQFAETFRKMRELKTTFVFLLAYWFYIDGVDTIVRMAVDYGLSLGFSFQDLILSMLLVQFIGFPSALGFSRLGRWWGVRRSILLAIGIYMGVTVWAMMMTDRVEFYFLAGAVGLVQGGTQSLSRSYYARLIPRDQAGEFFGFYNMLGKFAAIIGPALMGGVALAVRNLWMPDSPTAEQIVAVGRTASRWSIGSLLLLFSIGAVLLYFVDEEKGKSNVARFESAE